MAKWSALVIVASLLWLCPDQALTGDYNSPDVYYNGRAFDRESQYLPASSQTLSPSPRTNKPPVHNHGSGHQASPARQCLVAASYPGCYPRGFNDKPNSVGDITLLLKGGEAELSMPRCVELCCQIGPLKCQYIWMFKDTCFAVHCKPHTSNCAPYQAFYHAADLTMYVSVQFSEGSALHSSNHPNWIGSPNPLNQYLQHHFSPEQLSTAPYSSSSSSSSPSSSSSTFPSSSSTPSSSPSGGKNSSPHAVISPVHLETNVSLVTLSGQGSTGKGVLQYHWEVLSVEPPISQSKIIMNGVNTDTLHLSLVTSGSYTIQLTVTDGAGNRDSSVSTVVVHTGDPIHSSLPVQHRPTTKPTAVNKTELETTKTTTNETQTTTNNTETTKTKTNKMHATTQNTSTASSASALPMDLTPQPPATTNRTTTSPNLTHLVPLETALAQPETTDDHVSSSESWSLLVKIGVPVLAIVCAILLLSVGLVGVASCAFVQSEKRQYRYRRLFSAEVT